MKPLSEIPNQVGFMFTGVLRDGTRKECVVTKRPAIGPDKKPIAGLFVHTVEGFSDLAGWEDGIRLTDGERREIDERRRTAVCTCGHLQSHHSRFLDGLFCGCQDCGCKSFVWPQGTK